MISIYGPRLIWMEGCGDSKIVRHLWKQKFILNNTFLKKVRRAKQIYENVYPKIWFHCVVIHSRQHFLTGFINRLNDNKSARHADLNDMTLIESLCVLFWFYPTLRGTSVQVLYSFIKNDDSCSIVMKAKMSLLGHFLNKLIYLTNRYLIHCFIFSGEKVIFTMGNCIRRLHTPKNWSICNCHR